MSVDSRRPFCHASRTSSRLLPAFFLTLVSSLGFLPASMAQPQPDSQQPAPPLAAPPLQEYYQSLLDELGPLLSQAETQAFTQLQAPRQREAFLREFWRQRDPQPETEHNELQERWQQQVQAARQYYPLLQGDRARSMMLAGAPTLTAAFRGCGGTRPLEIWFYSDSASSFYLAFVSTDEGSHELWWPGRGLELLISDPDWIKYDTEKLIERFNRSLREGCSGEQRGTLRFFEQTVQNALSWDDLRTRTRTPAPVDAWVPSFLARLQARAAADKQSLLPGAELDLSVGGRLQGQTVLQGRVTLPLSDLGIEDTTELATLELSLEGELLSAGSRVDSFRYTFHSAGRDATGKAVELTFFRAVTPGPYLLRLEARGSQGLLLDRFVEVDVPEGQHAAGATDNERLNTLSRASDIEIFDSYHSVQLIPPADLLIVDEVEIATLTTGAGVQSVELWLNDELAARIDRPPFRATIDVGPEPQQHQLEAVALGADGQALARDRLQLNAGRHHFGVRLLEPNGLQQPGTQVRAVAEVEIPEAAELDRVELYLNETLLATLYQPPFIQPFSVPEAEWTTTFVRAVAYLKNGRSTEDLQLVQARGELDQIDVQLVELYATVTRGERLVMDLKRDKFQILEDGKPQRIERFERMDNLPINVVVLMDTSQSMRAAIAPATASALGFIDSVLTERDQAAFIRFNHVSQLVTPFTNSLERLRLGVSGLQASGGTRLYDSLIQAMYYFSGIEGKRALVLLSDGNDEHSHFGFRQVVDYGLRSGVAVYAIALESGLEDPRSTRQHRDELAELALLTGGRFFRVRSLMRLDDVYEQIQLELRSQYLLTYYSPEGSPGFRRVDLEVEGSNRLQVKTRQGYIRR